MCQVWKLKVLSVPDIDVIIKANINRFDTGLPFNTKKFNFEKYSFDVILYSQFTTLIFQKGASGVKREKPPVPIAERPPWDDRY